MATRSIPPTTEAEIDRGVPAVLDQLRNALLHGETTGPGTGTSTIGHGDEPLGRELTVSQVARVFGDVCRAIVELAVERNAPIGPDDIQTLSRCLDEAIMGAVAQSARERTASGIDGASARESHRGGLLAHDLRNLMNTALMAFEVLKTGNVGVAGSTGIVLHRTLMAARALVTRSLAEARLDGGSVNREPFPVAGFVEEIAWAAALEANARGIRLRVTPVDGDVAIEADRQILAAVVGHLLQNAFTFTRPWTTVTLKVEASAERVRIEVQDERGGLPREAVNALGRPFERPSADRAGVGPDLAFSRWGAEANGGRIYARDLPGSGCVFTVDLPRLPVAAAAAV